jgi:hypothetical protein
VSSAINNGFFPENMAIYAAGVVALLAEIGQVYLSVGSWSVILSFTHKRQPPFGIDFQRAAAICHHTKVIILRSVPSG